MALQSARSGMPRAANTRSAYLKQAPSGPTSSNTRLIRVGYRVRKIVVRQR